MKLTLEHLIEIEISYFSLWIYCISYALTLHLHKQKQFLKYILNHCIYIHINQQSQPKAPYKIKLQQQCNLLG